MEIYMYVHILALGVLFIGIPLILMGCNIYNCFSKKPKNEKGISVLSIVLGGIYYIMLHMICFDIAGDWNEEVTVMQVHSTISSEYLWAVVLIIVLGAISYGMFLFFKIDKIPPLVSVMCISALILFNIFQIVYAIQISTMFGWFTIMLYVYHFNILLLSANVIRKQIKYHVETLSKREEDINEHKFIKWLYAKMVTFSGYRIVIYMGMFLIIGVFEIVFLLVGQGLDAPVKMFTDTSDWTFSTQIPPPPTDHTGHYLCTVAAGGHKKIVKPLRLGTRRGDTIIVNRQLCIANAFEEVIQEKLPKFHSKVRYIYDKYGYPISKHITTASRADIIYIMMKPLEWMFLVFLYLVDTYPEKRISRQYKYIR